MMKPFLCSNTRCIHWKECIHGDANDAMGYREPNNYGEPCNAENDFIDYRPGKIREDKYDDSCPW